MIKFKLPIVLTIIMLILLGCANHLEKRRYRSGYYFSTGHKTNKPETHPCSVKVNKPVLLVRDIIDKDEPVVTLNETQFNHQNENEVLKPVARQREILKETSKLEVIKKESIINTKKETHDYKETSTDKWRLNGLTYFVSLLVLPFLIKSRKAKSGALWAAKNKTKAQFSVAALIGASLGTSFALGSILQPKVDQWHMIVPLTLTACSFALNKGYTVGLSKFHAKKLSFGLYNIASFYGSYAIGADYPIDDPFIVHPALVALATILIIGLFIASQIGLILLACELACAGEEVLAVIIYFGGTYLGTFLSFLALFNLYKRKSEEDENKTKSAALWALGILFFAILFFVALSF